ncbi:MAG: ImmA/IrrE family metallo-endopeptidase [Sphaerochaeta sp.]|nr:ImmA/IrrE family metallo-endopeptidase [Sphaerochaeta sp.]
MIRCASRLDTNGIPHLSKNQLESYGERVLRDFSPGVLLKAQPTDIDRLITEYMGFNFEYQYLSHNQVYLGITVFDDTDQLPIYNPELNRAEYLSVKKNTIIIEGTLADNPNLIHRERFTEGHEASHGLIHPEYYQLKAQIASLQDYSSCGYSKPCFPDLSGMDTNGKRLRGEAWLEWQANYLASVLLMPRSAVRRLRNLIEPKGSPFWHLDLIREMVEVFNVSEEAARVRLVSLNHLPI